MGGGFVALNRQTATPHTPLASPDLFHHRQSAGIHHVHRPHHSVGLRYQAGLSSGSQSEPEFPLQTRESSFRRHTFAVTSDLTSSLPALIPDNLYVLNHRVLHAEELRTCDEYLQSRTHPQNSRSVAKGRNGPSLTISLGSGHQYCSDAARPQ